MEKYRRRKNFYGVQVATRAVEENQEVADLIGLHHSGYTYSLRSTNSADAVEKIARLVETVSKCFRKAGCMALQP